MRDSLTWRNNNPAAQAAGVISDNNQDYATRIRLLKTIFTQKITRQCDYFVKNNRGEYNIWQKRVSRKSDLLNNKVARMGAQRTSGINVAQIPDVRCAPIRATLLEEYGNRWGVSPTYQKILRSMDPVVERNSRRLEKQAHTMVLSSLL